jgi:hypothetical protein
MGGGTGPRPPRLDIGAGGRPPDLIYDENGVVPSQLTHSEMGGGSLTENPANAGLGGKPWVLPEGTVLPDGYGIVRAPTDVDPTHRLLINTQDVQLEDWMQMFSNLPWERR